MGSLNSINSELQEKYLVFKSIALVTMCVNTSVLCMCSVTVMELAAGRMLVYLLIVCLTMFCPCLS